MAQSSAELKEAANSLFKAGQFQEAREGYTAALGACVQEVMAGHITSGEKLKAQIFANRAACALQLGDYGDCISDCNAAIELQPHYASALMRRSKALEATGELVRAREDALFVLQFDPGNKSASKAIDRIKLPLAADFTSAAHTGPEPEPETKSSTASACVERVNVNSMLGSTEVPTRGGNQFGSAMPGASTRPFDESRLLRDGEWEEWDTLMQQDAEQKDDTALAKLMEQQMQEMRMSLQTDGT